MGLIRSISGRGTVQKSYDTSKYFGEFSRRVRVHHILGGPFPSRVKRFPAQKKRHVLPVRRNPAHHLQQLQKPHLPVGVHMVREVALRVYVLNAHPHTLSERNVVIEPVNRIGF